MHRRGPTIGALLALVVVAHGPALPDPALAGDSTVESAAAGPPPARAPRGPALCSPERSPLRGRSPPRRIQVNKDDKECRHAAGEVQDVVVSTDGGLAGVVLEIDGVTPSAVPPPMSPGDAHAIRQKDCRFSPHLLVVPDGAELTLFNDDPVLHNINTGQWNVAQPPGFGPLKKRISRQGPSFVRVNCDIHPWMEAWAYVTGSPHSATTGPDGRFRIQDVPPGSYKVRASHPTLGTKKFKVVLEAGRTLEKDETFRAR